MIAQSNAFALGDVEYGVDTLSVQEIRSRHQVTRAPSHMLGVLTQRGSRVPIIAMHMRLHLVSVESNQDAVIIILSVHSASGDHEFGIAAGCVSAEQVVKASDRKEALAFGDVAITEYTVDWPQSVNTWPCCWTS